MRRTVFALGVVVTLCIVKAVTVHALTLQKATLKSLVTDSPLVLVGTVVGQQYRSLGQNKLPYTIYRLRLVDVVYGKEQLQKGIQEEIEIPIFGGLGANGRITTVVGTTKLDMGETYLLFLRGGQWSLNPISGWNQGAFRLVSAGADFGHLVLSMDGKALMDVRGSELIFKAPDFNRSRPEGTKPQCPQGSGFKVDNDFQSKSVKFISEEEEQAAERRRLTKSQRVDAKPEKSEKLNRQQQLKAMLGNQPLTLKAFAQKVRESRDKLSGRIPEDKRKFNFSPVPSSGKGMAPPKSAPESN